MVGCEILNLIHLTQVATFGSKCPTNPIITLINAPLLGTNQIHDFTAVKFSVNLAFFREKR